MIATGGADTKYSVGGPAIPTQYAISPALAIINVGGRTFAKKNCQS